MTVYRRNPLLMTVMGANPGSGPVDPDAARELELYVENDASLYRQQYEPIIKNLMKRRAKGVYNRDLAVRLFMYLVDAGARKYIVEFGTRGQKIDSMFNRNTRLEVARRLRDGFETEAGLGNYDKMTWGVSNNPGIGEAIMGGIAGAVASRAFQSNPHQEGDACAMCGGQVGYLGTLGQIKHYQCRNCGWETRGPDPSVHVIRRIRTTRRPPPQRPKQNPAIARSWDSLKLRPRLAILEFAGIPYEQAKRLAGRPWGTLPPSIREEVSKGWQENPLTKREAADALRRAKASAAYARRHRDKYYAGKAEGMTDVVYRHGPKKSKRIAGRISWRAAVAPHARPNPGPRSKRRLTMTIERFAQWVKSKRDPAMWRAFLAKFRGYEKWTHGARARKVTVEWVDTPGVNGLWITYDGGKQPESTYIMPKGSPRKGAWKHPWDTMPDIKHDPEAKIVITKLRGQSKITDFYHK